MTGYTKNHRWLVAGVASVLLLVGAACGGAVADEDAPRGATGGTTSGPMSTGDEFAREAEDQTQGGDTVKSGAPLIEGSIATDGAGNVQSSGGSGTIPGQLPSTFDRKIIMTATLSLETEEVSKRFEDVGNIAAQNGGFISSSSFGNDDENQTASITIRIPTQSYQAARVALRKLGDVNAEQSSASDVTEEYTDLDSRLRSLRAVEAQYVEFLTRATTIDEILTVQDRLNATRIEIEQVQGRINLLNNQTDLATITVHLDPPVVQQQPVTDDGKTTPVEALEEGWEASLELLGGAAAVVLVVVAFSWWLVPVWVAIAYLVRRQAKATKERQPTLPPPAPSM
ncbi:MAG: DUF4349 domain-containing protein [Chloroflexi bacterium]|nr:DUF4349 domain-containing protein [Chloroflexota bacterium]